MLSSSGHLVITAKTADAVVDEATTRRPDAIILDVTLARPPDFAVCRALRTHPALSPATPILLITDGTPLRAERRAALRAGAWELSGEPIDTEELLLRLAAYVQGTRELERVATEGLVDRPSGLYNAAGITRRSEELAALTARQGMPLACAVFQLATQGDGVKGDGLAAAFKQVGRISDAIGRTGELEFAVFAPATDGAAARRLVQRLREAVGVSLRAGFSVVTGTQRGRPADLLAQARGALESA